MWMGAVECLAHWGVYDPARPAAVVDGTILSYGMIASAAATLALQIQAQGLHEQRLAIVCREKGSFLSALYGAQFAGCSTIVFHPTWRADTIATTIVDTNPAGFLVDQFGANVLAEQVNDKPLIHARSPAAAVSSSRLSFVQSVCPRGGDDEWGIIFSSGSTGRPKPIVQTNYSTMTECIAWCIELGLLKAQSFYVARPLYYTGGLALGLATLMTRGLLIVDNYTDDNSETEVLDQLEQAASKRMIDRCFLVPELARAILSCHRKWPYAGNPKTVLVMGSKIHVEEKAALATNFCCEVVESWGNSEGLGTITDPSDITTRPGSIGRPFLTERLWIMDDMLQQLPSNKAGYIVGSDETMFKEYANQPQATQNAKHDNLVISDDIGFRDDDGFFYISGRAEDVVLLGDIVLSMMDIEKDLRTLQGVKDAYVAAAKETNPLRFAVLIATDDSEGVDYWRNQLEQVIRAFVRATPLDIQLKLVKAIPKLSSGKTDRVSARALVLGATNG